MPTWMAALILAAAIGATYFFCIRPMRRGECGPAASGEADDVERARLAYEASTVGDLARHRQPNDRDVVPLTVVRPPQGCV